MRGKRLGVVAAAVVLYACFERPPDAALASAKEAYAQALEAEAERYSAESLALASGVLDDAVAEIDRQAERPAWIRDYARARVLVRQARQLALGARYEARARRERLRDEAAQALEEASLGVTNLERAPPATGDVDRPAWAEWIRRYRAAADELAHAKAAFENGDYLGASAGASRVIEHLKELCNGGVMSRC